MTMLPVIIVLLALAAFVSTGYIIFGLPKTRPIAKVILVLFAAAIIFGLMALALVLVAQEGVVNAAGVRYFASMH